MISFIILIMEVNYPSPKGSGFSAERFYKVCKKSMSKKPNYFKGSSFFYIFTVYLSITAQLQSAPQGRTADFTLLMRNLTAKCYKTAHSPVQPQIAEKERHGINLMSSSLLSFVIHFFNFKINTQNAGIEMMFKHLPILMETCPDILRLLKLRLRDSAQQPASPLPPNSGYFFRP